MASLCQRKTAKYGTIPCSSIGTQNRPTTDGRQLVLSRYTQPEKDLQLLLDQLKLLLPEQPPPKIKQPKPAM
jgi:hypothetical protein